MRPGPNNKRPRGRGRGGKPHHQHHNAGGGGGGGRPQDQNFNIHRTIDSNGPDIKIRGNAHHIYEKYLQLARDSNSSGDRVMAENYLQHAEHYYRLIMAAQAANPQPQQQPQQGGQPQMGGQPYGNGGGQPQQPQQANYNNGGGQYRQPNGTGPQPGAGEVNGNVSDQGADAGGDDRYSDEEPGRYD
jgi:hypothetical protein